MGACCSFASRPHRPGHSSSQVIDEGIEFEKRKSALYSIYTGDADNERQLERRVTFEDWCRQCDAVERRMERKKASSNSARSDLYQILGLFFVFQGVILTAVAQANLLRCHNWVLPFLLCLLTYVVAFFACLQKLIDIAYYGGQFDLGKAHYKALQKSIDALKEEGSAFDVRNGQPDLERGYQESEITGKGTIDYIHSSIFRFCKVWIISYAGAVLFVLSGFSAITLFSIHQILCNPGS